MQFENSGEKKGGGAQFYRLGHLFHKIKKCDLPTSDIQANIMILKILVRK